MIEPGQKVTYIPGSGEPERGVISSIPEGENPENVFVVYSVGDEDWDNFENYTGVSTPVNKLLKGWPKDPNKHFNFYLHADKGDNYEFLKHEAFDPGEEPSDEFIEQHGLVYMGYEVTLKCMLTPDGKVLATHINGSKIEKPVNLTT